MFYVPLAIDFDDQDGWVTIRRADDARGHEFLMPRGFRLADIVRAAMATGWVRDREGGFALDVTKARCQELATIVEEILDYFEGPGQPSARLLKIKSDVDELLDSDVDASAISLEAYAWLDVLLRRDIADEARTVEDLWNREIVEIGIDVIRQRTMQNLAVRMKSQHLSRHKMAPSHRTRRDSTGNQRLG